MKTYFRHFTLIISILFFNDLMAQDSIPITTLSHNAEMLPVKNTSGGFKQPKISFGIYHITDGKKGAVKTREKGNLLGTKSQSTTTQKSSFTLSNGANSVSVELNKKAKINETHGFPIGKHVSVGEEKVTEFYDSVDALIRIDSSRQWELQMNLASMALPFEEAGILQSEIGNNRIRIVALQSEVKGRKMFPLPARGFLFTENDEEIAAVQFIGSGITGPSKKFVWLKKDLQADKKIILSAATAAILLLTEDYMMQ